MDLLGKIRRWHYRDGMGIREIAAKTSLSRNTVRKYLRDRQVLPNYPERQAPATKLTPFLEQLNLWLGEDGCVRRSSHSHANPIQQQPSCMPSTAGRH